MRRFRDLMEAPDTIVFAFGRFNPPTTGHEKLIKKVASVAGSNPYRIYPSFTQNPKRDPLPHALKVAYMRKMFKKYAKNIIADTAAKTAIMIAEKLYKEGYKNLIMVAGSDRVKEFSTLLNRYNDAPDQKGNQLFKFDSVKVVSAGQRDPDSEGVEGMSASKMRAAASNGDMDSFLQGVPSGFSDGKKLYRDVRKYMGIREEKNMGDMTDFETLRDAYLTGQIWNVGDVVEANGAAGEIVRKGTNYLSFVTEDGKVHKAWLHDIELDERNYAKEYANYQGTPDQIARRSSRNQARRVMGDKTKVGMDVGHADNDPMNNDPTNLRNEDPSKNRREPRLRDKELDEVWYDTVKAKLSQMTHPKSYGKMIQDYAELMRQDKYKNRPNLAADKIARERLINTRDFIKYINKLVAKKILPQQLKAEYEMKEAKSSYQKLRDFDKSRTAAGKKPIFKDKKVKFIKMKKKGQMTIMNVPSDEVDKYIKKGYTTEELSFKDFVNQIQEVRQDKDIDDKKGTQPAKYYAGDMAKSTKNKRDAHFKSKKSGPAPGDASAKTKLSVHTKKFRQMYGEQKMDCPPATQDLAINTKNRDAATKKYNYGPLNVDEPGDYWEKAAKHWKTSVEASKKSLCENCVAFDVSPRMKDCLPGATSDKDGVLGYCWMHHFKCHSARACHTWAKGGPIDKDKESHNWQERAFGKKEVLGKDADQGDYINDFVKSDAPQFKGKSKEKRKEMAIAAYLSKNESMLDEALETLNESGHTDVASMKNKVKIAMSALQKMQGELNKIGDEESLPTWWTNKVATAVSRLDDMSDYLDTQVESVELDEKIKGLVNKAEKSGMPYSILKKVYDRGLAAFKTGHRPGATAQQWAFARVNSFTTKSAGTWGKADKDLAKQVEMVESLEPCCDDCINEEDPCWDTHKQVGMKKKGGKMVPNCVPKNEEPRIPRKKGQPAGSDKHSDLYTDENPVGTIQGLGFKDVETAKASVKKIIGSGKAHAHKIQAAIAMEQRAKEMGKSAEAAVYRKYIDKMKQKTKEMQKEELNEWGEITEADAKSGKELNNPTRGDVKKYKVYVRNDKGNVVKVEFGDPNMSIKRDDPARRKAFRARHNCDQKKDKTTAGYWSCKFWSTKSVTDLMKG